MNNFLKDNFIEIVFILLFSLDIILWRFLIFYSSDLGLGTKMVTGLSAFGLGTALVVFLFCYFDEHK